MLLLSTHAAVGVVEEVGSHVVGFQPGDRVGFMPPFEPCRTSCFAPLSAIQGMNSRTCLFQKPATNALPHDTDTAQPEKMWGSARLLEDFRSIASQIRCLLQRFQIQ